jgi:murein DD-endopeptidase MepM/ murein hydrolase activator NlpD
VNMNEEKGSKGIKNFLDKKGFYIVLFLCIAVIAGTVIFLTARNADSNKPDYNSENLVDQEDAAGDVLNNQEPEDTQASAVVGKQSDIGNPASVNTQDSAKADDKKENTDTNKKGNTTEPSKSTTPKDSGSSNKKQSFQMPVNGTITLEYAMDKLVYSKTLEEWRAHNGIDIAADMGTAVKAAADGVVTEVKNDSYLGIYVVIDHEDGTKSLYRNLASDDVVAVNQKVKQGEVIGSVGNSAMDESSEESHLHFEVFKDDVNVDPMDYFASSSSTEID